MGQLYNCIAPDKKGYPHIIFSYFSTKMYVLGTLKMRLAEALLLSTHYMFSWIFFRAEKVHALCGARQLHSLSFKILECENLKRRRVLHVLCIFRVILTPPPSRIFARKCVSTCARACMCVCACARMCVVLKQ